MFKLLFSLLAINYPIWTNAFFYLFIAITLVLFIFAFYISMQIRKKNLTITNMTLQHANKIDIIRGDHSETLEKIRVEMVKREEERTRQWIESEKEALRVLNGVSIILDRSDKIERSESEKIIKKLDEIYCKIDNLTIKN
jgi:hypothetical protein